MSRLVLFLVFLCSVPFCLADNAEQQIIERYREILVKSPKRGATFDRVYGHYVDTGQSILLYQECQAATQNQPSAPGSWILFGLVAERRNKTDEAAQAFQTAAELEPNDFLPMLYLGELLLNQRRIHEAIAPLEEARDRLKGTSNRNDLRTVLQTLALAYTRFGDPQKSLDVWNQLAALFPNDPDILVQVAETMEFEGRLDEALKQYRRLLTMIDDPAEHIRISLAAIDIMLRLGNDEPALNDLDSLLGSLDSESYLADAVRNRIDRIFDRARDPRRQIEFYQKRIEKEPNDTASLLRLVRVLQRTGSHADAEKLLLDTIKVLPSNISLRLTLIDLLVEQGNVSGAIEQFRAMDKITPVQTDHLIRWGTLTLQNPDETDTDRRTEAARIWQRISAAAPNDPVAAVLVADLLSRNKFYDEAELHYKKAMALRSADFSYREHLAMFYHRQNIKGMVLETLSPTGPRTFKAECGQLLLTLGYIDEAAQMLAEAVQNAPRDWSLQYRYFESLLRQNTPESFLEIAKLYTAAERSITENEQFVLFLQQTVQLLKAEQKTAEAIKIVQASTREQRDVSPPVSPSMRSLWHLAMLYQADGNFTAAVAAVEKAMETAPAPLPLLRFAAELYEQSGNASKAIALYQKLTQDDPARSGEHWKHIIAIQIQRGELPQALESSQNLLGRGTENADRLRFVADLFLGAQRQGEAVKLLQQALILEPGNTDVLRILAQTLAESDRHEEAIELLWRLYERLDHPSAKLSVIEMLASEYGSLGRDDELIELLQQLSRHYDHRRVSMQALARVFTVRGDHEEAQNALEILLDLPDDGKDESDWAEQWVLRELVAVTERQDDFAAAVRYQEMLCQKSADLREHNHLFYLYDKLGDTAQVRRLFFDQILRQGNWQDRLDLIDMMIRREQHDIVLQVLDFLDIHESEHWAVGFRRILIKTYQNEPIRELILEFRSKRFEEPPVQTVESHLHHSFVFTAYAPAELNAALIFQNQFLPVLFYPERHDTGLAEEKLPEEFFAVRSFQDARFLTLGLLLREAFYKERTATGRPTGILPFPAVVEELRTMLPADSEQYGVLMDRLRLEVWLLDLSVLDELYQIFRAGVSKEHVDERVCQQAIWQIVRKLALGGTADWQPALFQILVTECINELVAERFKTLLSSDAQLTETLVEILDGLCRARQIPPLSAEDRSRILDAAAYQVKRSATEHEASLHNSPLTLAQKTERILSIWSEFAENPQSTMQDNLLAYNTLLWILREQNREADAKALELSLPKIVHQRPLWRAKDIYEFTNPVDENLVLFRALSDYDSLEGQLLRFQSNVAELLPLLTDKEEKRTFCILLFQDMSGSLRRLQRYDIFTPSEQALFRLSTQQIWNYLQVPSTSQQGRLARQFFGADSLSPGQQQILNSGQIDRLAELDRSLRQISEFAFQVLDELKLEPADLLPALSLSADPKFSLIRYRSELQGDRPVERTIIYPLLQNPSMSGDFSAVDELFCRNLLIRRALDTKAKLARTRNDEGLFVSIPSGRTQHFAVALYHGDGGVSVPANTIWRNHIEAVLGDLLRLQTQPTEPGSDTELLRLVQKLETGRENRTLTLPEKTALALLYVRLQRFEDAVSVLDSMEFPSSADLPVREWIIAGLAVKHGKPESVLLQRGNEAATRLLNFRLLERDMINLATVLQHFQRDEEAQRILDRLVLSVSDHRLMTELFYKMNAAGDLQKENAAKIAQRILQNPAFLQNSRRLTADVFLLEAATKTLQRQDRAEAVVPILEARLRGLRDKTDSRILLAKLYLELDRREEAKELTLELALNPTAEPERRQMIVSLLVHFGLQRELEAMNRLLLERNNRP